MVIFRVGQSCTHKNTAYLDTLINVSVYGNFRPYTYQYGHTWVLADRKYTPYVWYKPYIRQIWTVFAGGAGFDSQQQQSFLLFLVNFFSRASSY